jgi:hypothetical protein
MKTMKTIMLAGFGALSLGAGLANAQNLSPSAGEAAYFAWQSDVASTSRSVTGGQEAAGWRGSSGRAWTARTNYFDNLDIGGGF